MNKALLAGAMGAAMALGGCAGLPGSCTMHQCAPVPIAVDAGCNVRHIPDIHVSSQAGANVEIRFVLGPGARAFGGSGIVIKSDPNRQVGLVNGGPSSWTLVDRNTARGATITYGVHVVDGNGVQCALDPIVINDM